jgi:hypothetical protein
MPTIATDRPLQEAVDVFSRKVPVGSTMSSREWELIQAEIRLRSMFSARVESERLLAEMQFRLQARIALAKKDGRTMDRGVFIEEMRAELTAAGYKRGEAKRGSLRDLKSSRRLGLIWDMNLAQAQGYAKWKAGMDPDVLQAVPAQELIRVRQRTEIRDWPQVWEDYGGRFYGQPSPDYPRAKGRMIALKTDPIWRRISRFKTPWPPFDWGSGMGLKNIRRDQAEALGLLGAGEELTPLVVPFNAGMRMSIKDVPEDGRESLRSAFGDAIRIDGDEILLQRETSPETYEQRTQDITASLRERARTHYLQARAQLERIRQGDDGAEMAFPGEVGEHVAEIYLAQASAVAVGRKQVFHDTMPQADAEAFIEAGDAAFPPQVAMRYDDVTGDMLVWRRDLIDLNPTEVNDAMRDGRGGLLLGFGLDSPSLVSPGPRVAVGIYRAPRNEGDPPLGGFEAPVASWRTYAHARAKDFEDALGIETELAWEVFP